MGVQGRGHRGRGARPAVVIAVIVAVAFGLAFGLACGDDGGGTGVGGTGCWLCAPATGFDDFRDLVVRSGFLAPGSAAGAIPEPAPEPGPETRE